MKRKRRKYNPERPLGRWWQDLDELEQIQLVETYHRRSRVRMPNVRLHAAAHVAVENQILLGDETPVAATLKRLQAEGLDRHNALLLTPGEEARKRLEELTAAKWLAEAEDAGYDPR